MRQLTWFPLLFLLVAVALGGCEKEEPPKQQTKAPADDVGQSAGQPEVNEQLLEAVAKGDIKVVEQLLAKGADVGAKNAGGETILNQAVFNSHKEMVELLIEKGANVNEKYDSGETPLHLAVHLDDLEIAEVLIKKGANVNAKTPSEFLAETPLDRATITSEIVRLLRKHGGKTAMELEAEQK